MLGGVGSLVFACKNRREEPLRKKCLGHIRKQQPTSPVSSHARRARDDGRDGPPHVAAEDAGDDRAAAGCYGAVAGRCGGRRAPAYADEKVAFR